MRKTSDHKREDKLFLNKYQDVMILNKFKN
jgi:hypothetical protein